MSPSQPGAIELGRIKPRQKGAAGEGQEGKKKDSPKLLACGGYQVVAGPTQGKERSVIAVEFGEGVGRWKRIESETGEWWFVRRSGESVCRVLCGRNVVSFHARCRTATRRPSSRGAGDGKQGDREATKCYGLLRHSGERCRCKIHTRGMGVWKEDESWNDGGDLMFC